jgi:hypothetical protein
VEGNHDVLVFVTASAFLPSIIGRCCGHCVIGIHLCRLVTSLPFRLHGPHTLGFRRSDLFLFYLTWPMTMFIVAILSVFFLSSCLSCRLSRDTGVAWSGRGPNCRSSLLFLRFSPLCFMLCCPYALLLLLLLLRCSACFYRASKRAECCNNLLGLFSSLFFFLDGTFITG